MSKYTTVTIIDKTMNKLDVLHTHLKKSKGHIVDTALDKLLQEEGIDLNMSPQSVRANLNVLDKMLKKKYDNEGIENN